MKLLTGVIAVEKLDKNLLNANNHSQNVHKSIKQNQQSVKDDVKVLTDKTTSWERI